MKKMSFGMVMVLILMFAAVQVQAFDGDRQGFMLNLGAGFGQAKTTMSAMGVEVSLDEKGFGGDFKIGGGINPQTLIYYTNRTLFYTMEMSYSDPYGGMTYTESADLVNGMSALGVSYFLQPQAPSAFFTGALGIGVMMDSEASESENGMGFTVGVGFEFSQNWIVEATYMKANVAEEMGVDVSISNLMVTLSWLAY